MNRKLVLAGSLLFAGAVLSYGSYHYFTIQRPEPVGEGVTIYPGLSGLELIAILCLVAAFFAVGFAAAFGIDEFYAIKRRKRSAG